MLSMSSNTMKQMKKSKQKEAEAATAEPKNGKSNNEHGNESAKKADSAKDSQPTSEDEIARLKEELASAKDQNLRLYAEFENFKRRNAKERLELMSSANQEVMHAMLPILDDFERAIKNIEKADDNNALLEGVKLIYNKMLETLKQKGLKPMDSSIGEEFDVERMEAITRLPVPDKKEHNKVIDEVERGYLLGDKVLRYARVVVAHNEE